MRRAAAARLNPPTHPPPWCFPVVTQVGNFIGAEPTRSHEERSHFSLWAAMSVRPSDPMTCARTHAHTARTTHAVLCRALNCDRRFAGRAPVGLLRHESSAQ